MSGRSAVIAAADAIDPALGAFITVDPDAALREVARGPQGRLAGMVVAVKDLIDVAGMRVTYGSPRYTDQVATSTAAVVDALRAEGAIVLGKTNLNEYAFGVSGYNPHFGPILVPGDTERTAGGSSGGSAAAVAAGVCRLAVGTDTSGSVRLPAACCGVWGLKCAHGANMSGIYPLSPSYDSIGYLADGPDTLRLVLGISETPEASAVRYAEIGVDVEVPALPAEHWTVFGHEALAVHGEQLRTAPETFGADLRLKLSRELGDLESAREVERVWRDRFERAVAGYDVVIGPVLDGAAPLLSAAIADYEHDETAVTDRLRRHTPVANALGWPALAFPTARGPREVLGRPGSEAMMLTVAEQLSRKDH